MQRFDNVTAGRLASGQLLPAPPDPLVEGIEDMQVSGMLRNQATCTSSGPMCYCDDYIDDVTGLSPPASDCSLNQTGTNGKYLRGVQVQFTARGRRGNGESLPPSYDRFAASPVDNIKRYQFFVSVVAPNLNPDLFSKGGQGGGGP
jgi:hypothetical protein